MQTLILKHYPTAIQRIREMKQIAKAEDIEFSKLNAAINGVICNMFVQTADETGVARFENMLGITPKRGQGLENRKIYILFMMNRKKITLSELKTMLSSYCEGMEFICNISDAEMIVEMSAGTIDVNTVNDILEEILPLNIFYYFKARLTAVRVETGTYALHRTGGKLKVKAFMKDSLKCETEADGKIKGYQRSRQDMRIKRG